MSRSQSIEYIVYHEIECAYRVIAAEALAGMGGRNLEDHTMRQWERRPQFRLQPSSAPDDSGNMKLHRWIAFTHK